MASVMIRIVSAEGIAGAPITCSLPCLVGRDASCTFKMSHASCSSRHALIQEHGGQIAIVDRNSRNGLYDASGTRVTHLTVSGVTRVRLGQCWIEITPASEAIEHTLALSAEQLADLKQAGASTPDDWLERALRVSCGLITRSVLVAAWILAWRWTGTLPKAFVAMAPMIALVSLVLALVTFAAAKLFSGRADFRLTFKMYIAFMFIVNTCESAGGFYMSVHPESTLGSDVFFLPVYAAMVLVFLFNLRLIWGLRGIYLKAVTALLLGVLTLSSMRALKPVPQTWKRHRSTAELNLPTTPPPSWAYVQSSQFVSELGESIQAARAPNEIRE